MSEWEYVDYCLQQYWLDGRMVMSLRMLQTCERFKLMKVEPIWSIGRARSILIRVDEVFYDDDEFEWIKRFSV